LQYLLLFLEGIITFISPCILPMLPIYVSYFAANDTDSRKTLVNAIGFVTGFTIVFALMGAFAGTIGRALIEYSLILNIVTGAVVIVFGLNFMGILKIGFLNRVSSMKADVGSLGFFSSVLFGLVFSIAWTPCVGAFLGSALMIAAHSGSAVQGVLMLLVFSLGLGIPFVFSAVLIERLKGAFDLIKKNYKIVSMVSGLLLVAIGVLMATGLMGRFLALLTF
jgi:cytochrome c-type biogenesis protein